MANPKSALPYILNSPADAETESAPPASNANQLPSIREGPGVGQWIRTHLTTEDIEVYTTFSQASYELTVTEAALEQVNPELPVAHIAVSVAAATDGSVRSCTPSPTSVSSTNTEACKRESSRESSLPFPSPTMQFRAAIVEFACYPTTTTLSYAVAANFDGSVNLPVRRPGRRGEIGNAPERDHCSVALSPEERRARRLPPLPSNARVVGDSLVLAIEARGRGIQRVRSVVLTD